jgi:hypothetical protein
MNTHKTGLLMRFRSFGWLKTIGNGAQLIPVGWLRAFNSRPVRVLLPERSANSGATTRRLRDYNPSHMAPRLRTGNSSYQRRRLPLTRFLLVGCISAPPDSSCTEDSGTSWSSARQIPALVGPQWHICACADVRHPERALTKFRCMCSVGGRAVPQGGPDCFKTAHEIPVTVVWHG